MIKVICTSCNRRFSFHSDAPVTRCPNQDCNAEIQPVVLKELIEADKFLYEASVKNVSLASSNVGSKFYFELY